MGLAKNDNEMLFNLYIFPGVLAIIATVLFALQIDEQERYGFKISRGISFYIQVNKIVNYSRCRWNSDQANLNTSMHEFSLTR